LVRKVYILHSLKIMQPKKGKILMLKFSYFIVSFSFFV